MNRLLSFGVLAAGALLASGAAAQQNDVDPAASNGKTLSNVAQFALGTLVAGPFDVETGPFDNRCLGTEEMGGFIWVTGADHTTIGYNPRIHQFDMNGTYIQSFPQVTNATSWGGRDMQSVGNTLYAGSDNGEVSEYSWNGVTLTHVALHTVTGATVGTVRALCQKTGGNFYTKSFTSSFYEFSPAWAVVNTVANAAVSSYGFGYDAVSDSIWSTTTGPGVQELDTGCVFKGGAFGPTWGTAQGGADVYSDSRNPGFLSMLILGQGTPDQVEVYDLGVSSGPPPFTLASSGTCPGMMTLSTSGGTPGGPCAYVYGTGTSAKNVPGGPCGTLTLNVGNSPTLYGIFGNNGSGATTVGPFNAKAGWCGLIRVQCVDVGSCSVSNVVTL